MSPDPAWTLRLAARAMHRHGLAHAYGHVSTRLDAASFLVSPARPLGTVTLHERGVVVAIDGDLPVDALPEVRIHREIYRNRPEIGGVVRVQPPAVMALSAIGETPRVLHGLGAYFAPHPPLWKGVSLVRDDEQARQVAMTMGENAAVVLSGNGCVTGGATLEEAAGLSFFLEDAARVDLAVRASGCVPRQYTPEEARQRAVRAGALFERMWHYLCFEDAEWEENE